MLPAVLALRLIILIYPVIVLSPNKQQNKRERVRNKYCYIKIQLILRFF